MTLDELLTQLKAAALADPDPLDALKQIVATVHEIVDELDVTAKNPSVQT